VVVIQGSGPVGSATTAAALARRRLEQWHHQFSRFEPDSELSTLNRDPRHTVPVSPMMARFVEAALGAAARTGGLVDPTLLGEIERAGYRDSLGFERLPAANPLQGVSPRVPASPSLEARWREVTVDERAGTVRRPPGVRLDSGGIAKGLFGDLLAAVLGIHRSFAIAAAGDVRVGGTAGLPRAIEVASPLDDAVLHVFELAYGAAATSGISRRSWIGPNGRPAHHLLDPATGRPAFTGVTQVTALAYTGVEAEALSKAALLSGPERAGPWLQHGGLIVYDDGTFDLVDPPGAEPWQ
jgi:thiamine biosynthesis lipoprotein